jgi:nitrite reductase (NADH) large subunit
VQVLVTHGFLSFLNKTGTLNALDYEKAVKLTIQRLLILLSVRGERKNSLEGGVEELFDIVVVGSGPVGQYFVQQVIRLDSAKKIKWFGEEEYQPYHRLSLTPLLSGKINLEDIFTLDKVASLNLKKLFSTSIVSIDRKNKWVIDNFGYKHRYKTLVIATGSRPFIPLIPGAKADRVYHLRNLKDVNQIQARTLAARNVVVIGGGLLGLEVASALLKHNTHVTVLEQNVQLMSKQLDERASELLRAKLEKIGVLFRLGIGIRDVMNRGTGESLSKVAGVRLLNGEVIDCDTLIFCTGIRPEIRLATNASLLAERGIIVNEKLQTSDPSVYAVGDCIQFNEQTLGMAEPGFDQASIAAQNICNRSAQYRGSVSLSVLKVVDLSMFSIGNVQENPRDDLVSVFRWESKVHYRKIYIRKGVIVGAISLGEWSELNKIRTYIESRTRLPLSRRLIFSVTGQLFNEVDSPATKTNGVEMQGGRV